LNGLETPVASVVRRGFCAQRHRFGFVRNARGLRRKTGVLYGGGGTDFGFVRNARGLRRETGVLCAEALQARANAHTTEPQDRSISLSL